MSALIAEDRAHVLRERERFKSERSTLPPVGEFLAGRNVLVTGGSGFLGRLLVEMLLRVCPDIGNVYLILRTRRGVAPADRLQALVDVPVSAVHVYDRALLKRKIFLKSGQNTELCLNSF